MFVIALAVASAGCGGEAHGAVYGYTVDRDRAVDGGSGEIERLHPSAFPDLPGAVRAWLEEEQCLIPQAWRGSEPHNVIRGHFATPEQGDWAALCSRNDTSSIRVLWGGPQRCESELEASPDRHWTQGIGGGEMGYSRRIRTIGRPSILRLHAAFGGREPPHIEHEGIDEMFVGKASSVRYCYDGDWITLTGSD